MKRNEKNPLNFNLQKESPERKEVGELNELKSFLFFFHFLQTKHIKIECDFHKLDFNQYLVTEKRQNE